MKIYHFDEKTKEYITLTEAEADPEETRIQAKFVPLVPANATLIPPPECADCEAAYYNRETNS